MKYWFLIIGLIWIASLAEAQLIYNAPPYEYELIGKGGRAAGMGYAFTGVADDATAIFWNPAGIAQMNRAEVAMVNRLTFTNVFLSQWPSRQYKPIYSLEYFGLVLPFKLREKTFSLGVSFQNQINYKEHYTSYSRQGLPEEGLHNNITINSVSGCIGYALSPFFYLGASFNTWFSIGSRENYDLLLRDGYISAEGDTFDEHISRVTDSRFRGLSLTIGALVDFSNYGIPYRLSLRYESPKFIRNKYKDISTKEVIQYVGNSYSSENWEGGRMFYINNIVTLGMSYRLGDYFTLACDLDYKPFSKSNFLFTGSHYKDLDPDAVINVPDTTQKYFLTESAGNMHQIRVGAEYLLKTDLGFIPLRAGWKWSPTSLENYNIALQRENQVFANSFTAGLGIIRERYSIDLAYEYYGYQRNDRDGYLELGRYHFLVVSAIYNF